MKRKVTEALSTYGPNVWYFFPGNNGFGKSGVPDLVVCAYGKFIGIEVKSGINKKPTKLQALQGSRIREAGGTWALVRSVEDIAELKYYIDTLTWVSNTPP